MNALRLDGLGKSYGHSVIVEDVSLVIREHELVSLIGHSGCGKSTVLAMVAGLLRQTHGTMSVGDRPIRGPGLDRGVVFQTPCLLPWLDVLGNVRLGVDRAFPRLPVAERTARAERALQLVGLGAALHARPASLSSGMRQRAALARAFALEPAILLLDEPFGMLDSVTRTELQDELLALTATRPTTTLLVTHDIDEALLLSDRIAVMTDGPAARIRTIVDVPFARPRCREQFVDDPAYDRLRARVLALLE
jgi:nitrate ABC transporter ATP-binding subunit